MDILARNTGTFGLKKKYIYCYIRQDYWYLGLEILAPRPGTLVPGQGKSLPGARNTGTMYRDIGTWLKNTDTSAHMFALILRLI